MDAAWNATPGGTVFTRRALLPLYLLILASAVGAEDLPPPPGAQVQQLAGSTSALGMQLRIRRFSSDMPVEQVLAYYRKLWKEYNEFEMPPWRLIGRLDEGNYLNVQVQPDGDGGSWGYLSIGDLPKRLAEKRFGLALGKEAFPMMSGSTLINEQVDDDVGKKGRTLLISNSFSAQSNRNFYRNHYRGQDWSVLMDKTINPGKGQYALFFQRGGETVALAIQREQDATVIVANHVKRGLLR